MALRAARRHLPRSTLVLAQARLRALARAPPPAGRPARPPGSGRRAFSSRAGLSKTGSYGFKADGRVSAAPRDGERARDSDPRPDNFRASSFSSSSRAGSAPSSSSSRSSSHQSSWASSDPAAHASSSASSRSAQAGKSPYPHASQPNGPRPRVNFAVNFDALGIDLSTIPLNPFATLGEVPSSSHASSSARPPAPSLPRRTAGDWSAFDAPVRRPPAAVTPVVKAASPAVSGTREMPPRSMSHRPPKPVVVAVPPPTVTPWPRAQLAPAAPLRRAPASPATPSTSTSPPPASSHVPTPAASPSPSSSQTSADGPSAPPAVAPSPLSSDSFPAAPAAPLTPSKPSRVDHIAFASKHLLASLAQDTRRSSTRVEVQPLVTPASSSVIATPAGPVATSSFASAFDAGKQSDDLAHPKRGEASSPSLRTRAAAGRTDAAPAAWPAKLPARVVQAGSKGAMKPALSAALSGARPSPRVAAPAAPAASSGRTTRRKQLPVSEQQQHGIAYPLDFLPLVSSSRTLPPIPLMADDLAHESVHLPAPLRDLILVFTQPASFGRRSRAPTASASAWATDALVMTRTIDLEEVVPDSSVAGEDPLSVVRDKEQRRETFLAWLVRGLNLMSLATRSRGPVVRLVDERYLEVRFPKTPRGKSRVALEDDLKRMLPVVDPLVEFASRFLAERATPDDLEPPGRRVKGETELRDPGSTLLDPTPALSPNPWPSSALTSLATPVFAPHPVFYGSSASSPFECVVRPSFRRIDVTPVTPSVSSTSTRPTTPASPPRRSPASPATSQISSPAQPSPLPSPSLAEPAPSPLASRPWAQASLRATPALPPRAPPLYVETPWGVEVVRPGRSVPCVDETLGWVGWQQMRARVEEASA